jgi:2'-5' RNA ligase
MIKPPLILTLSINKESALFFNFLRKKYFPPSLNFIDAHLTLFHALPYEDSIITTVKELCEVQMAFVLTIKEVVSIGKGVAFKIESSNLMQLHKALQNKWLPFLSAQDRQKLWPHITIQNKMLVQKAQELLNELKDSFTPLQASATGLQLFEYLNGPWKLVYEFVFKDAEVLKL